MDPWQPYAVAGDFHFITNTELNFDIRMTNLKYKLNQPADIDF